MATSSEEKCVIYTPDFVGEWPTYLHEVGIHFPIRITFALEFRRLTTPLFEYPKHFQIRLYPKSNRWILTSPSSELVSNDPNSVRVDKTISLHISGSGVKYLSSFFGVALLFYNLHFWLHYIPKENGSTFYSIFFPWHPKVLVRIWMVSSNGKGTIHTPYQEKVPCLHYCLWSGGPIQQMAPL